MRQFPIEKRRTFGVFKKLDTPAKIQSFINTIPINFEYAGETLYSPLTVLKKNVAHCFEGALLAAAILWYHGRPPLLLDLETTDDDESHVIALFKQDGHWGAISKTNHAVLRFRDPIYKTIRELALSYFHEYTKDNGKKTLRRYSKPLNLTTLDDSWLTASNNVWHIDEALDAAPHFNLLNKKQAARLRKADAIEIKAGKIVDYKKKQH